MIKKDTPLSGEALVKEVCRRIRVARSYWDAHNNAACRHERERALQLYNTLTIEQKEQVPQVLRVWLRYQERKVLRSPSHATSKQIKAQTEEKMINSRNGWYYRYVGYQAIFVTWQYESGCVR